MQTLRISRTDITKQPAVYILTNTRNGTLYTGVTSDPQKRVWQHKNDLVEGFSKRYSTHMLVFYEIHEDMINAITREKQIKCWKRAWKIHLIEAMNPYWRDLYSEIL
jgi:putative endonuclease